ncbi:MAG: hypothetical protein QXK93_06985 [Candidatus Bathyarchaeia archaeon]
MHFTVIGREEEDMLGEDMKTRDLNSIDSILARKKTPASPQHTEPGSVC